MLLRTSELRNYVLRATDDELGRCRDFLFDDEHWTTRYMEANTGKWLMGRRVLISPIALMEPDLEHRRLPVALDKEQIERSPGIETDQPVSRQFETEYHRYFGYGMYWLGGGVWGTGIYPGLMAQPPPIEPHEAATGYNGDEHMRSVNEVTGYDVRDARDVVGMVDDFIVDTETWMIRYLAVDTRRWLPGKKVLLPPQWASDVSWPERTVTVDVGADLIRSAPELDEPIDREEEAALFAHYGRAAYWQDEKNAE